HGSHDVASRRCDPDRHASRGCGYENGRPCGDFHRRHRNPCQSGRWATITAATETLPQASNRQKPDILATFSGIQPTHSGPAAKCRIIEKNRQEEMMAKTLL